MKTIFIAVFFIIYFYSCSSSIKSDKNLIINSNIIDSIENKPKDLNCPEEGNCFINVTPNKGIIINNTPNGLSYKIIDDSSKTLIQFQYSKNQDQIAVDGSYRETVFFEINNTDRSLELNNIDLQKVKMIYGRYCNCRGKSGVFLVKNGHLKLKKINEKISFILNYYTNEIPQIINKIVVRDNILF